MKKIIKRYCRSIGIYYPIVFCRQIPFIIGWLRNGCPSPAPHIVKMIVIRAYLRKYNITEFIETGTFLGDTLEYIAREKVDCISIELSEELHSKAKERFSRYPNVTLIQGDSTKVLPEILEKLDRPALFWLDGHYSGGNTAKGLKDSPISEELEAIHNHRVLGHVILIDDARCFNGDDDYPHLDELLDEIRQKGIYSAEVSTDIIRLVPLKN